MPTAIVIIAPAFALTCMISDLRARRIPGSLSAAGLLGGIAIHCLYFSVAGLWASLTGLVLTGGVLFLPFAMGGIGGGDVKMMAAVGALMGPLPALAALVIGMILGGVIMAAHLARLGLLMEKLAATRNLVLAAVGTRSFSPLQLSPHAPEAVTLPYSIPLGLGTIAVVLSSVTFGAP